MLADSGVIGLPPLGEHLDTLGFLAAAMTGTRYGNMMAVCRSLRAPAVCPEIQETPYTNEQNGQTYLECRLTKRDSLVLIVRLSPDFTARVVDHRQELEADAASANRIPPDLRPGPDAAVSEQADEIEYRNAQSKVGSGVLRDL